MRQPRTLGPITVYPRKSAMRGAVEVNLGFGWLCWMPPWGGLAWYLYFSRDATPDDASWRIGPGWREIH